MSIIEAEYMILIEAMKKGIWLKGLIGDLSTQLGQSIVYSNSQSAIYLTKNQMYHERTKHIDVRFHFIQEVVSQEIILIKKMSTDDNPTDMLTKHIIASKFRHCLDLVGVCSC